MNERRRHSRHAPGDDGDPARAQELRWTSDNGPGIRRYRKGRGFTYRSSDDHAVDAATIARIRQMAIPPAWNDVWISPSSRSHLLATGRDAKNRKQYIYHPLWREIQDQTKFHRMSEFGKALPKIRERLDHDLRQKSLSKSRVLAAMICLLDETAVRIGNQQYARENGSYGLTTVSQRHAEVSNTSIELNFVGKSGKQQSVNLRSPRVSRVVAQCCELPGQQLFVYRDQDDIVHEVHSEDVNEYLKQVSGGSFTAKDFRTWRASVVAARELATLPAPADKKAARQGIKEALQAAADVLGNTPAICRKSYVHPYILEAFESGELHQVWQRNRASWRRSDDEPSERLFRCLLRRQSHQSKS